jgi:hypothetical protein
MELKILVQQVPVPQFVPNDVTEDSIEDLDEVEDLGVAQIQ